MPDSAFVSSKNEGFSCTLVVTRIPYVSLSDATINKLGLLLAGSWAVSVCSLILCADLVQQSVAYLPVKSCCLLTDVGNRGNARCFVFAGAFVACLQKEVV